MDDDPLMYCINLHVSNNTPTGRYMRQLLEYPGHYVIDGLESLKTRIHDSDRSKISAYRSMNPELIVHPVYNQTENYIPEYQRVVFSRIRLIPHNLRIETGRWARLPPEERLCLCGDIQSEKHVIQSCILSQPIRDTNPEIYFVIPDVFYHHDTNAMCKALYDIYQIYM